MIFLYAIMCVVILCLAGVRVKRELNSRKTYNLSLAESKNMSWPAKEILQGYHQLPVASRPIPNISSVVSALDVKHGGAASVNEHFTVRNRNYDGTYNTSYSWNHSCYSRCDMSKYREIFSEISSVSEAVKQQEYAQQVASVSGGLEASQDLIARLREEREIVKSVTKALSQ